MAKTKTLAYNTALKMFYIWGARESSKLNDEILKRKFPCDDNMTDTKEQREN